MSTTSSFQSEDGLPVPRLADVPEGYALAHIHGSHSVGSVPVVVRSENGTQYGCLACWIEDDLSKGASERLGPRVILFDEPGHENTERHVKAVTRITGVVPQVHMWMCPRCGKLHSHVDRLEDHWSEAHEDLPPLLTFIETCVSSSTTTTATLLREICAVTLPARPEYFLRDPTLWYQDILKCCTQEVIIGIQDLPEQGVSAAVSDAEYDLTGLASFWDDIQHSEPQSPTSHAGLAFGNGSQSTSTATDLENLLDTPVALSQNDDLVDTPFGTFTSQQLDEMMTILNQFMPPDDFGVLPDPNAPALIPANADNAGQDALFQHVFGIQVPNDQTPSGVLAARIARLTRRNAPSVL